MTWFEAIIIYLAVGAPFGVHRFFSTRGDKILTRFVTSLFHFVLWVPFALISLTKLIRPKTASEKLKQKIANLQTELERADIGKVSIFEIRRVIERYVGLRSLTHANISQTKEVEFTIFDIAKHPDPELATICLNRRNRDRILRHQTDAGHDLKELIGRLMTTSGDASLILQIISQIAGLLNDHQMISELSEPMSVKSTEVETRQWTEIQKPPTNSPATIDLRIQ